MNLVHSFIWYINKINENVLGSSGEKKQTNKKNKDELRLQ